MNPLLPLLSLHSIPRCILLFSKMLFLHGRRHLQVSQKNLSRLPFICLSLYLHCPLPLLLYFHVFAFLKISVNLILPLRSSLSISVTFCYFQSYLFYMEGDILWVNTKTESSPSAPVVSFHPPHILLF